jgi:hypothetical protein
MLFYRSVFSLSFEIINHGRLGTFLMKHRFGENYLLSPISGPDVFITGEDITISQQAKACFLGKHYAQLGDGIAIILQQPDEPHPQFKNDLPARWKTEMIGWGPTITTSRRCNTEKLKGIVRFPSIEAPVVNVTMQLQMPTLYARYIGPGRFINVNEDVKTVKFNASILRRGSEAEEQYLISRLLRKDGITLSLIIRMM